MYPILPFPYIIANTKIFYNEIKVKFKKTFPHASFPKNMSRRKSANGDITLRKNTGRDGSPVGSASPLAEQTGTQPNFQTEVWAVKNAPENKYSLTFSETELNHNNPVTNPLVEGTQQTLYGAGSTSNNKNSGGRVTLVSISTTVPAFTRFTANVTFLAQNYGRRSNSGATAWMYASVNSYGIAEINQFYSKSMASTVGNFAQNGSNAAGKTILIRAQATKTLEFINDTAHTKTLRYFLHMSGANSAASTYSSYSTVTNYITLNSSGMQRLVPTSYDVEYDQLRHSLEEEYYEAIRLDENYPTEADPPCFVPTPCAE